MGPIETDRELLEVRKRLARVGPLSKHGFLALLSAALVVLVAAGPEAIVRIGDEAAVGLLVLVLLSAVPAAIVVRPARRLLPDWWELVLKAFLVPVTAFLVAGVGVAAHFGDRLGWRWSSVVYLAVALVLSLAAYSWWRRSAEDRRSELLLRLGEKGSAGAAALSAGRLHEARAALEEAAAAAAWLGAAERMHEALRGLDEIDAREGRAQAESGRGVRFRALFPGHPLSEPPDAEGLRA